MALLTYQEASSRLAVPVDTLYGWVSEGRIPHVRLGPRTVRFETAELDAWLDERRFTPAAATG